MVRVWRRLEMGAVSANAFIKTRACPTSEEISSRRLPRGKSAQIARHVVGCEFCTAEQSFLSDYNKVTGGYVPAEMPANLRRLAEALLMGKLKDSTKRSKYHYESALGRTGFRV
jgi:hypothetical protein